ncbi:processive 1,2-diacylglycerol beta-glucosyltransferase [Paenibacillus cellulosilyticus]|uniref:Processive 1,2-diacylglycerol beta-glucosyltransferase n=1 Tax=Paenibacillus cellulosilyticus TaxID=375489 RepID=A0A2V2YNH0_9BACL|nr:glycosyltransferase [Paenibacillus cellulosilyticus]PWV90643.1 processive 1,2-diacylglycerol beta-glucosyltransferase [Paenibacillus cellulosilyticus]QKS43936.1 glycosyltransferase [Paenibacillus cellulosilyticus]
MLAGRILIIYASYGDGHLQAARAIRDALQRQGIEASRIRLVDLMAQASPLLNEVSRRFYMHSYSKLPTLYGWVYDRTRPMKHDSLFGGWLHSFGKEKLRRLLLTERPDAVVYTFPVFAAPASRTKAYPHVPTSAVVTDFDLHCRWVHPHVDRYFVATAELKTELVKLGIADRRITVSGIPIKPSFAELQPNPQWYAKYGFPEDRPIVLVMAGAAGVMPDVPEVCEALLEDKAVHIALVCGRNETLAASLRIRFQHQLAETGGRLHLFGYVETIHELMAIADCLVTKPGGITLSEGLAAGLPLFIYRPVPGQEKHNALFLHSKGAAQIARHPQELSAAIRSLLHNPIQLAVHRQAARALGRSGAADTVALDILQQCLIMEEASSPTHY